ncbi:hypothetical protein HWV23_00200 [Natronomonas halophila]|uniref:hypothetical protein n=1 Tax=Natronomonas halophila TaxID=2747817 RepID=UPI0015B4F24B|nr:hypothetical protein [Natronomonas halophila]QLD84188.1 hypothetical protein HWV23_00200 [Natronomonas halophila]
MVSRRAFLTGVAAAAAGCNSRNREVTETVTPVPIPESEESSAGMAVADSRFDESTPVPDGVRMFHRIDTESPQQVLLRPTREVFTPAAPTGQMLVRNHGSEPLFVSIDWRMFKYTGHRWLEIRSPQIGRSGINPVDPGDAWARAHRIESVFSLATLGPGLYARVETARFQQTSEDQPPVGALFEVADTTFEFDPARPATIEDGVARVAFSDADSELVFERTEASDPVELVPEAVGAIPIFRDSIPYLDDAPEVRLRTASAAVAAEDIGITTVRDVDVELGDPLRVAGRTFRVRVAES